MKTIDKWMAILLLLTGAAISVIAGFVSVFGMTILFAGHALVVGAMMASVEFGKIVSSSWLKLNWKNKNVPFLHRCYLIAAIAVCMILTGLGLFGFLSAAYLEQSSPQANIAIQAQAIQQQIDQKNDQIKREQSRLDQIGRNVDAFLSAGSATKGLKASGSFNSEKKALQKQLDADYASVNDLTAKLAPIKAQSNEVDAKLGPIKYVAALFGMTDPAVAVRIVIAMIMSVFDPLAIMLIISAVISFTTPREEDIAEKAVGNADAVDNIVDIPEPTLVTIPEVSVEETSSEPSPEETPEEQAPEEIDEPAEEETEHHLMMVEAPDHGPIEEVLFPNDPDEYAPLIATPIEPKPNRAQIISLLESDPDFVQQIVDVLDDIRREQESSTLFPGNEAA